MTAENRGSGSSDTPNPPEPPRCECGLPASVAGTWCSDCYIAPMESLKVRLKAFGRDCVKHGDMTPMAARMLGKILEEYR